MDQHLINTFYAVKIAKFIICFPVPQTCNLPQFTKLEKKHAISKTRKPAKFYYSDHFTKIDQKFLWFTTKLICSTIS